MNATRGIVAAVALIAGVGIGVGVGLAGRDTIRRELDPRVFAQAGAEAPVERGAQEQTVIRVARQASPAVVSVSRQGASGSGVIVRREGIILTNAHVVGTARQVVIGLADGRRVNAEVIGRDPTIDIAVVRMPVTNAPIAPIGDSDRLEVGQDAIAIGNPLGLDRTVTSGVVSAINRSPAGIALEGLIQTDAAISPGNSGGPLVDTAGEVIGINARGMMAGGGDMGFAIPSETIREILPQLRKTGKVEWSWTGIQLQPIKDFNRNVYFDGTEGVIVADTDPESPARSAGILPRDRIMSVGGKPSTALMEEDLPAIRRLLGLLAKDVGVKVELQRDGKPMTVELTPREKGKVQGDEMDLPRWDLTLKAINQFETPDLYFHRKSGVFVNGVRFPGNAGTAGLRGQDIVLRIDGKAVGSLEEAKEMHKKALENADGDSRVLFTVLRNGLMKQIVLDYSRDHARE